MTPDQIVEAARALVGRSTAAQDLPAQVDNPAVVAAVARVVVAASADAPSSGRMAA